MRRLVLLVTLALAAVAGCKGDADVNIVGNLGPLVPGDSVFVTLSRDWDKGVVAPVSFDINSEGKFVLRFHVHNRPEPVTFVKNDSALACLEFKDTWGYAPVLVDKLSKKEFAVEVVSDEFLKAKVVLP